MDAKDAVKQLLKPLMESGELATQPRDIMALRIGEISFKAGIREVVENNQWYRDSFNGDLILRIPEAKLEEWEMGSEG